MRKKYIDHIRWITEVLVVIYHVIYMYNGAETAGVIGPFSFPQYQDAFLYLIYPWFMLILFVISGMCSRYELEKRTGREYLKRRTEKLLIPSTIGVFVFHWIDGYFNMLISNAFAKLPSGIPGLITYLIMALSGIGPLWYIQMLWIYSVLLILIRKIEKDRLYCHCRNIRMMGLLMFSVGIWLSANILNVPAVSVYRFGIYGFGFFSGYFVFSHDRVIRCLTEWELPLLAGSGISAVLYLVRFWGEPYAEHCVLDTFLCNVYAWITVLAILAYMNVHGNYSTCFSRWMEKHTWGLYLLHYLPLSACAWFLHCCAADLPPAVHYILTAVAAFAGAWLLNAVIMRIPLLRVLILGRK